MVNIIVAAGKQNENLQWPIGKEGKLPWDCKEDLQWFKKTTLGSVVIMGRKTFESIGKPLPNRVNYVLSTQPSYSPNGVIVKNSLKDAIEEAKLLGKEIFIIGGEKVFWEALAKKLVDKIYIDFLNEEVEDADAFFPNVFSRWKEDRVIIIGRGKGLASVYTKENKNIFSQVNIVDQDYLMLLEDILDNGVIKETRSGVVRSVFGRSMRINLSEGFPLLTTKKVYAKGVIAELLWFLRGDTNIKYLIDNNVHIWDDDAYRYYKSLMQKFTDNREECQSQVGVIGDDMFEIVDKETFIDFVNRGEKALFFEKIGDRYVQSTYTFGDLGPVYGKQWRNYGTNGKDQITDIIYKLKNSPDDRRIILSAWNSDQLESMALPPCHVMAQFYTEKLTLHERWMIYKKKTEGTEKVLNDKINLESFLNENNIPERKLSCMWYQRSVDFPCGLPFNIASYALLTNMLAKICNMVPSELIFNGGDCHIYENQVEGVKEQLKRTGSKLPKLNFLGDITDINDFDLANIQIVDYFPKPPIKFPLNVG